MQGSIFTNYNFNCCKYDNCQKSENIFSDFSTVPCISLNDSGDIKDTYLQIKSKQGFIGRVWDGIKNLFNSPTSSKQIDLQIEQLKKGQIQEEVVNKNINKYAAGQTKIIDIAADLLSTNVGFGAYCLATKNNKATYAIGLCISACTGALAKVMTKYADAKSGDREYKTAVYDIITGGIDGILGPFAKGISRMATKESADKLKIGYEFLSAPDTINNIERIINYPKSKLKGNILKRIAARLIGQTSKTATKYSLSTILREVIFLYIAMGAKQQDRIIATASLFLPDDRIQEMKKNSHKFDTTNNIFSKKVKSRN